MFFQQLLYISSLSKIACQATDARDQNLFAFMTIREDGKANYSPSGTNGGGSGRGSVDQFGSSFFFGGFGAGVVLFSVVSSS
jgi:hypothetical protein